MNEIKHPQKKNIFINDQLAARIESHSLRTLREVSPVEFPLVNVNGKTLVNFSSNDYLGLANDPRMTQRSIEYTKKFGTGSGASRLVCGSFPFFAEIESKIAKLKGTETALVMNSGFQANVSLVPALADRSSIIIADRLSHNSIVQGAMLSRGHLVRYRHNDMNHLQSILEKYTQKVSKIVIVTESVFSMDGDRSDIDQLVDFSIKYGAILIVDEAHATGVLGAQGMGLACGKDVDVIMGTFGKGCGSYGAYIACSQKMKEYLVNFCSGFIYSTALPPGVLGAISAALDLVPQMDKERKYLQNMANSLRVALHKLKFNTCNSSSQIVPVVVGSDHDTVRLADFIEEKGILAVSIRPPTVEQGQARIRVALSSKHTQKQIDQLINAFKLWKQ